MSDSIFVNEERAQVAHVPEEKQQTVSSGGHTSESTIRPKEITIEEGQKQGVRYDAGRKERGFRRIIRNFTPS